LLKQMPLILVMEVFSNKLFLRLQKKFLLVLTDLNYLHSSFLHSLVSSIKMIEKRRERDSMVDFNDKIILKKKLNVRECILFKCRESKSQFIEDSMKSFMVLKL
jgi:hypothetical protein